MAVTARSTPDSRPACCAASSHLGFSTAVATTSTAATEAAGRLQVHSSTVANTSTTTQAQWWSHEIGELSRPASATIASGTS